MNVQSTLHIFMNANEIEQIRKSLIQVVVVLVTSARLTLHVQIPWEATNVHVNRVSTGMEDSVVKSMNVNLHELIVILMQIALIKLDFMFANVNLVSGQIQLDFSRPFLKVSLKFDLKFEFS